MPVEVNVISHHMQVRPCPSPSPSPSPSPNPSPSPSSSPFPSPIKTYPAPSSGVESAPRAFVQMMAGGNAGKALVAAAAGDGAAGDGAAGGGARAALPRGWRAAEALRALLPARLKGAMASAFVTEVRLAAAAESMP